MLLGLLNNYQQDAYATVADQIMAASGPSDSARQAILAMQRSEMGDPPAPPPSQLLDMPNLDVFDTRRSRIVALMELYVLAYAGRPVMNGGQSVLDALEVHFGLNAREILALRAWARRQGHGHLEAWGVLYDRTPDGGLLPSHALLPEAADVFTASHWHGGRAA